MRVFTTFDEVVASARSELGVGEWVAIDQERIDQFAEATGDHQWIHVDPERARSGPFGATIAHGYLTLSLLPWLGSGVFRFDTPGARLNYGINKVRFPTPVPVESRVRVRVAVGDVIPTATGLQVTLRHTIEIAGVGKPACVAETLVLLAA